jgi:hypothetical protein
MSAPSSIVFVLLLTLAVPITTLAQGRSPLLDQVVQSVEAQNPKWHFVPGVCVCPVLVPAEVAYAFGSMRYGKLSSTRRVSINVAYVPTAAIAKDSMTELRKVNDTAPYRRKGTVREGYIIADEAYLWTYEDGSAALYFRNGTAIGELLGAPDDVRFFARTLIKAWAR